MRYHLRNAAQLRQEFPAVAASADPIAKVLPDDLVTLLQDRAASAFDWLQADESFVMLEEDDVRLSVAVALDLAGVAREEAMYLSIDSLMGLASEIQGLRENHVLGSAFFDKPVAPPPEHEHRDSRSGQGPPALVREYLATAAGRELITSIVELLQRANQPDDRPEADA
jgi:hypothetical protein